jgi:hypothetical protein
MAGAEKSIAEIIYNYAAASGKSSQNKADSPTFTTASLPK